jgi:hypothetical protein
MLGELPAQGRKMMERMSPFKRLGTVADVGDSVALLASESARWISGQAVLQTHCSSQCSPGLEKGVIMYAWFLFTEQSTPHPIEVEQ